MMSADSLLGQNFSIMVAGMDGLTQRMQVNQNNITGLESGAPGFQAQTVDFESTLKAAMNKPSGDVDGGGAEGYSGTLTSEGALGKNFVVTTDHDLSSDSRIAQSQIVNQMSADDTKYRLLEQQVSNRISELKSVFTQMGRS